MIGFKIQICKSLFWFCKKLLGVLLSEFCPFSQVSKYIKGEKKMSLRTSLGI